MAASFCHHACDWSSGKPAWGDDWMPQYRAALVQCDHAYRHGSPGMAWIVTNLHRQRKGGHHQAHTPVVLGTLEPQVEAIMVHQCKVMDSPCYKATEASLPPTVKPGLAGPHRLNANMPLKSLKFLNISFRIKATDSTKPSKHSAGRFENEHGADGGRLMSPTTQTPCRLWPAPLISLAKVISTLSSDLSATRIGGGLRHRPCLLTLAGPGTK